MTPFSAKWLRLGVVLAVCAAGMVAQGPAPKAEPDVIVLKNGDRMTGKVVSMSGGTIVLKNDLLGDVKVPLDTVQTLSTAGTVDVTADDGEKFKRRITGIEGGDLLLSPAEGREALRIPLARLKAFNEPPATWTGSITAGATLSSGNTDRRGVSASANAVRRTLDDRISAKADWQYSEEKNASGQPWEISQRRVFGELQYDYFVSKKVYVYANTSALYDVKKDLQLRYQIGAGLGYQLIEEKTVKAGVEAGLAYYSENYRSATPDEDTVAARAAGKLDWEILPWLRFLEDATWFPSLENGDYVVTFDSRLQFTMIDNFFAQLQWLVDYDNSPSTGRERTDQLVGLSIGWNF